MPRTREPERLQVMRRGEPVESTRMEHPPEVLRIR